MIWASDHLASWCWTTVLPLPNGPGTQAVPPLASGKNMSMTRCPVTSGSSGMTRSATGRWRRMDHVWNIGRSFVPSAVAIRATMSATPKLPALISTTLPAQPSGTMIRCTMSGVSWTAPRTSPSPTASPALQAALNSQTFARSSEGISTPRVMKSPVLARMTSSGRWMPS